jgi:hypothetical protein|tara:strand:+ start:291 stop:467 length:177 start_codon:yes stop_codon:yes gene_type:complete
MLDEKCADGKVASSVSRIEWRFGIRQRRGVGFVRWRGRMGRFEVEVEVEERMDKGGRW